MVYILLIHIDFNIYIGFDIYNSDRLEFKLRKLQKASLQDALSKRKLDEARRFLDARLGGSDYVSSASTQYSEVIYDFTSKLYVQFLLS